MTTQARILTLADALVEDLRNKQWSRSFELVGRKYVPTAQLEKTDVTMVTVAVANWEASKADRSRWAYDYEIDIAAELQRVASEGVAAIVAGAECLQVQLAHTSNTLAFMPTVHLPGDGLELRAALALQEVDDLLLRQQTVVVGAEGYTDALARATLEVLMGEDH